MHVTASTPDLALPPGRSVRRSAKMGGAAVLAGMLLLAALSPNPARHARQLSRAGALAAADTTERDTTQRDTTERDTTNAALKRDSTAGAAPADTAASPDASGMAPARAGRPLPADSAALARPARASGALASDTLVSDSLAQDSLAAGDTLRLVPRYRPEHPRRRGSALFPAPSQAGRTADLLPPRSSFWAPRPGSRYRHRLTLDSTGRALTAREQVGTEALAAPLRVDRRAYRRARRTSDLRANWLALRNEHQRRRAQERRGLGVSIAVPGGRESAFTTVFGKNEVALDINGQADINAGFDYRKSDQQAAISGDPIQLDPAFKQDLRLGITGTIGDKMQIDVNWDTQSQFNYQNQVKLRYTGYEDEIIQRVEAGNVFLETPSTLIDGGQSLFGIKSQFQLGGLRLTTVASQQEGQSQSLSIEGGSETTEFDFSALGYDHRRHFFLAYYFRNTWERAHANAPAVTKLNGFDRIIDIEVWKTKARSADQFEDVAAVVDLGEPAALLQQADGYDAGDAGALPDSSRDQYGRALLDRLRSTNSLSNLLEGEGLSSFDYQQGEFELLERGRDYVLNDDLGYLSLQQSLRDGEALAVAFRYRAGGQTHEVGDFSGQVGSDERLVLKLLRPANLPAPDAEATPPAWYLQMRNIYELQGRGFDATGFELDVKYNPPGGTGQSSLPELGGQRPLLQLLGLDRLDDDSAPRPNGRFDFLPGFTINQQEGRLIFPYLQPFGARLRQVIEEEAPAGQQQALIDQYVFSQLYTDKPDRLESGNTETDRYRITGSSKGSVQDFYDLKAFSGIVEGSVSVTAGGTELTEGTDYQVNYQGSTVTITNKSYLAAGREINIEYEKEALLNLQKKTLLGARADYRFRDNLTLGATLMRLSQRSPADKLRIGQEPIKNTIWGVDAALELQPRWLTRAVDALPLLETKAPSALSMTAEFAQLRPGHTQTQAFERTRRRLQDEGRDFAPDERKGISYLDDFEGFENSFSLKAQLQNWRLAAAPLSYEPPTGPASGPEAARAASRWRGTLAWYQLNNEIVDALEDAPSYDNQLKEMVRVRDVFPNRDTRAQVDNTLRTLDFYFDPRRRGPYNYTENLRGFLNRPEAAWGGITQRLPEGQTDFGVKNIEFVEFVFKPYPKDGSAADSAALYLDLGTISEDVLPNGELNREDGLSLTRFDNFYPQDRTRESVGKPNNAVDIEGAVTEDLGLDGLASYAGSDLYGAATEEQQFSGFLDALPGGGTGRLRAEVARARLDPSGDDYHFYEDEDFFQNAAVFPGGATFQEHFAFYYPGVELNSYQAQNTLPPEYAAGRGNTRTPDSEDFAFDGVGQQDRYFQYRIPLNEALLKEKARPGTPDDFIVGEIKKANGEGTGWYQARIPVRAATDSVGSPDLSFVEQMRLWTTGHRAPITLRFATLELVGSQWRKSERVTRSDTSAVPATPGEEASRLTIASINNEEDSGIYQRPQRAIVGQQRLATGGRQNTREQSLVLRVEDLDKGKQRAIFKNVQNLNLLKYGGLRLFAHLHSTEGDFQGLTEQEARGQVELFVRLGANETGDYYEYRQPLTPTLESLSSAAPEELWYPLDAATGDALANEMNLRLTALNQLKVARDRAGAELNGIYWNDKNDANPQNDVPLDPALGDFAPAGARIGVKGTPSLQNVSTVVIGLRVSGETEVPEGGFDDLTLWVNELRATEYDEQSGWKAVASANVQLADFADVQASFQRQTDGWGALASTLGERQQNRLLNWNVRAAFDAEKLLPGTAGWRIPVTLQFGSRTSTPRYAPNRGDVRLGALLNQARSDEDDATTAAAVRRAAQTYSADRSMTVGLQKTGSQSPWLRYTLDQLNFSYNLLQSTARNPSLQHNDRWTWSADLDYRYDFERPRTVRPLWFLEGVPLVGGLGGLHFNYAPQSVGFYGGLSRNGAQQQDRPTRLLASEGASLRSPIRDQHTFKHERRFDLQYNPFEFLRLTFNTRTNQSLNRLGANEQISVVGPGNEEFFEDGNGQPFASDSLAREFAKDRFGEDASFFVEDRLNVIGAGGSLRRFFSGASPRTNDYQQRFTAALDLPFDDSEALNWIDLEDVAYEVNYGWRNGPRGQNLGAQVSNEVTLSSGVVLHPQAFWRKFGFYRRLEKQQEEAEQAPEAGEREEDAPPPQEAETPPNEEKDEAQEDGSEGGGAPNEQPSKDGQEGETKEGASEAEGAAGEEGASSGSERSFSDLPLPNPLHLLRRLALAVTGIRDFSIQYDATRTSESSHVGFVSDDNPTSGSHTLLDALRGDGPPLGYRFGFGRRIGMGLRLPGENYSLDDRLRNGNQLRARTTIRFSEDFRVDLNWKMDWQSSTTYSNVGVDSLETRTRNGSNASSIWAFGGGYRSFFENQLAALQSDRAVPDSSAGADGRVALTNASMSRDFRRAFVTAPGTIGESGFLALPLPSWQVTYSGLSDWPLLRSLTQSIRLTHSYSAEYASNFRSASTNGLGTLRLGGRTIEYPRPAYNGERQSVQERYQPLIGLDIDWTGALRTNLAWNRTRAFFLRPASAEVVEDRADEWSLTADYRTQGLEIPFLPFGLGNLDNQITFSLNASRTVDRERDFLVRDALSQAAGLSDGPGAYDPAQALQGENVSVRTASTRLQVSPSISYRLSNRISVDFAVRYERFTGNQRPSYSNIDGGFNVRVSLQQ